MNWVDWVRVTFQGVVVVGAVLAALVSLVWTGYLWGYKDGSEDAETDDE